jgi:hypothetical protein
VFDGEKIPEYALNKVLEPTNTGPLMFKHTQMGLVVEALALLPGPLP